MKTRTKIVTIIVIAMLTMACTPLACQHQFGMVQQGDMPTGVKMSTGRDYLWGAEKQNNGLWQIWFRYDGIGVYCTLDDALGQRAQELLTDQKTSGETIFHYRDFTKEDKEVSVYTGDWNYSCTQGFTSTQHGYKLLDITLVDGR